ncbi:hypothetical protein L1987_37879 [Smallanthus sonchifolius]|uniref:Uncharacterized protein n=1 Tax=Smallanthus sonchifolius TaxID=185202 RepID=A0ACB9HJE3_9ASTR|nr:hypothetical protein L1987_37879 [Smallanthus sonchifolius]
MASQQQMRRKNKTDHKRELHVDQSDVPQVSHYESLTVMDSGAQPAVVHRVVDTMHGGISHDQRKTQKYDTIGEKTITTKDIAMETGKTTAEYAGKAAGAAKGAAIVAGRGAAEFATEATTGAKESLNAGVSGLIENTAAAAEGVALGTVMDVGKKGAVAGKDITLDTGKATMEYVGKGAAMAAGLASDTKQGVRESAESLNEGVARVAEGTAVAAEKGASYIGESLGTGIDITLQTGKTTVGYVRNAADRAAEFASDTAVGVRESMESLNAGVGGVIEDTAVAMEMVGEKVVGATGAVVDLGKKGAVAGKDITLNTGKTTAGYVSKAGRSAAEMASDAGAGLTVSMERLNKGVGGLVEGTALATEKVAQKTFDTAVAGKDITLETGKATAEYARKAAGVAKDATLVGGWGAVELASDTASGVTQSMETLNHGVAGLVEGTALAQKKLHRKHLIRWWMGVRKGLATSEKSKDITLEIGKATAEYVGKGASVVKDATLVGGWSALECASDTAAGVTESMEDVNVGVAGLVENAAFATELAAGKATGLKDVVLDMGKKGASYIVEKGVEGKDITLETGKTTVGYVGKAADVVKDATLVAGWSAAEVASDTAAGVTESMESLNAGVAGLVEGTALATEGVAQKTFDTGKYIAVGTGKTSAEYVGKAVDVAKGAALAAGRGGADIALETGKTSAEYAGKVVDVAKGTALAAGRGAAETIQSKESSSERYVGVGTKPKNVVVEREEITVDYAQRRNTGKETNKGNKEQGGYHR